MQLQTAILALVTSAALILVGWPATLMEDQTHQLINKKLGVLN